MVVDKLAETNWCSQIEIDVLVTLFCRWTALVDFVLLSNWLGYISVQTVNHRRTSACMNFSRSSLFVLENYAIKTANILKIFSDNCWNKFHKWCLFSKYDLLVKFPCWTDVQFLRNTKWIWKLTFLYDFKPMFRVSLKIEQ